MRIEGRRKRKGERRGGGGGVNRGAAGGACSTFIKSERNDFNLNEYRAVSKVRLQKYLSGGASDVFNLTGL